MRILYLFSLLLATLATLPAQMPIVSSVQTVEGGCTSVNVTFSPTNIVVVMSSGQTSDPGQCQVVSFSNFTALPKVWLEQEQPNGSYTTVRGGSNGIISIDLAYTFNNLAKGTYRVRSERASFLTNNSGANCPNGIEVFNSLGQPLGFRGAYGQRPSSSRFDFSDPVVVGRTSQNDIQFTFIDNPEQGSESTYEAGEDVEIDLSDSEDYDRYFIGVFEKGPTKNRYAGTGSFRTGPVSSFNITQLWISFGHTDGFLVNHSYEVQVVLENDACPNSSWNQKFREFFICAPIPGQNCRLNYTTAPVTISPNPTTDIINFGNLTATSSQPITARIFSANGALVRHEVLLDHSLNVSTLAQGMYFLQLSQGGAALFSDKFVKQ